MTFAPGKNDRGMYATWDRDLGADLERLVDAYRTSVLLSLVEDAGYPLSLLLRVITVSLEAECGVFPRWARARRTRPSPRRSISWPRSRRSPAADQCEELHPGTNK